MRGCLIFGPSRGGVNPPPPQRVARARLRAVWHAGASALAALLSQQGELSEQRAPGAFTHRARSDSSAYRPALAPEPAPTYATRAHAHTRLARSGAHGAPGGRRGTVPTDGGQWGAVGEVQLALPLHPQRYPKRPTASSRSRWATGHLGRPTDATRSGHQAGAHVARECFRLEQAGGRLESIYILTN